VGGVLACWQQGQSKKSEGEDARRRRTNGSARWCLSATVCGHAFSSSGVDRKCHVCRPRSLRSRHLVRSSAGWVSTFFSASLASGTPLGRTLFVPTIPWVASGRMLPRCAQTFDSSSPHTNGRWRCERLSKDEDIAVCPMGLDWRGGRMLGRNGIVVDGAAYDTLRDLAVACAMDHGARDEGQQRVGLKRLAELAILPLSSMPYPPRHQ
jgi:hypothetical protein